MLELIIFFVGGGIKTMDAKTNSKQDDKLIAAGSYFLGFLTGILFYLMYKGKDKYIEFHALQSVVFSIVITLLYTLLFVSIIGWILLPILGLGSLALWAWLMYQAYLGVKYKLPVIGDWCEKQV